jgi:ABC-type multidrug transport system ATPase subunit
MISPNPEFKLAARPPRILHMNKDDPIKHIKHPAIAMPMVLRVQNLSFRIPERELFSHWSAAIPPGVTLVCGGEGRGKTTLLRLLAGDLSADAGHLQVNDVRLRDRPAAYRQQIFWADPRSDAFDRITPAAYFKSLRELYPTFDEQRLDDLVKALSLEPHVDKQLFMLSTGSKRKVWLAAAFASNAAVTLLDEPFTSLDKVSIGVVTALLKDAAGDPRRACVTALYEAPGDVPLAAVIDLGD